MTTLIPTPSPTKILLVDDLAENLLALEAVLRSDQLEILTARSGVEALELLLVHEVALALVDVQMPEMDGFELAEFMRGSERTRHVPIIFVTAGAQERSRLFQGYDAGAVDFLFKPIEPRVVRNKVNTFVELHCQRQMLSEKLLALQDSEAETRRLRDELAQTLRLNETFLGVVGHDLRNPLNTVLMAASLLKKLSSDPSHRPIIDRISSAVSHMGRMIDDLYDLTRARMGGGISLSPRPGVDLGQLAERTATELGAIHPAKKIIVEKLADTVGFWDYDRLAQVVSNLVGNALRHGTPDSPVLLRVDGSDPEGVVFRVDNSGVVPAELLPHVFEPFRRNQTSRREGLGLGLFIVQQLVHAHKGTIEIRSENSHTCVEVRLPRRALLAAAQPTPTAK